MLKEDLISTFTVRLRDLEQVQQAEGGARAAAGERLPRRQRHQGLKLYKTSKHIIISIVVFFFTENTATLHLKLI